MAENKQVSYFTYSDIERTVKKRLKEVPEEDNTDATASLKKHLFVTQNYYIDAMDKLEALKKKDKANERKIEKIQKDVKSIYLLSAITLKLMNNDTTKRLNEIQNVSKNNGGL